jgi:HSP20 family protein
MEPGSNDRPNDGPRQSGSWQSNYSAGSGGRESRGSRSSRPGASWGENAVSGLLQISREVDRAIESIFARRTGSTANRDAATPWSPSVEVRREGENVVIHADLPGMPRDSVRIECTTDGITLSGHRQETRTERDPESNYYFSERSYGSFRRHIPLPEGAQTDQAKATMRDGVLQITVPVSRDVKRRSIEIAD